MKTVIKATKVFLAAFKRGFRRTYRKPRHHVLEVDQDQWEKLSEHFARLDSAQKSEDNK